MVLEHERYYGLGTDALVIARSWNTNMGMDALRPVCSWNTNVTWVWAWNGLGMDALRLVCSWNTLLGFGYGCSDPYAPETQTLMVWAWML